MNAFLAPVLLSIVMAPGCTDAACAEMLLQPGEIVPPLPGGMVSMGGRCLGNSGCERSIGVVGDDRGNGIGLYSGDAAGQSGDEPLWEVIDAIRLPSLGPSEGLTLSFCLAPDYGDGVVAVVDLADPDAQHPKVVWAAGVGPVSGRWKELDVSRVECTNPLWPGAEQGGEAWPSS